MRALVLMIGLLLGTTAWADRVAEPPAGGVALAAIPEQELTAVDAQAQARMRETRERLDGLLAAPDPAPLELAAVYGRLGALYAAHRLSAAAASAFANACALDPGDFNWAYYAAHLALDFGEPTAALERLAQAQVIDPEYPTLALRRGEALLGLNRLDEARAAYELALAQPGQRAAALYGLAQIDLLHRAWADAADRLREVLELAPQANAARYGLGQALLRLGQRDAAREYLDQVGTVKPDYPDRLVDELHALQGGAGFHFEQAMAAVNRGEDARAVVEFAAGLEQAPDNARARTSYGRSLWIAGNQDQALAELRRAAADGPQETLPRYLLAVAAEAAGDLTAAEAGYRDVIALDPQHQGALSFLGSLKLRQAEYAAAAELLGAAIDAGANMFPLYLHHWGALRAAGTPDAELRAKLAAYDQRFPEPPVFRYLLAKLLAGSGAAAEAVRIARELQQAQPIPPHTEVLALALAAEGDFSAAVELQSQLVDMARQLGAAEHAAQLEQVAQAYRESRLPAPLWLPDDPMFLPSPADPAVAMRNYPAPNPY